MLQRLLELRLIIVMDHHQRLALFNLGADLLDFRYTNRVIDLVVGIFFAGSKQMYATSDHGGVDRVNVAALGRRELADVFCRREFLGVIDEGGVTTLSLNQILEFLEGRTVSGAASEASTTTPNS